MTTFVGHTTVTGDDDNLQVDSFYPEVTTSAFLSATRNDVKPSEGEIARHLTTAMYSLHHDLFDWRQQQVADALESIQPTEQNYRTGDELVHHYLGALYAKARSLIMAYYRDASATGHGHQLADEKESRLAEYQAQAWEHIRAIKGHPRIEVELI